MSAAENKDAALPQCGFGEAEQRSHIQELATAPTLCP